MRKSIVIAVTAVAAFSLSGCGGEADDSGEKSFIEIVRADGPEGVDGWSEGGWEEIGQLACEWTRETPGSLALNMQVAEMGMADEGRPVEEIEALGWIMAAGVAYYCPEELETFVDALE